MPGSASLSSLWLLETDKELSVPFLRQRGTPAGGFWLFPSLPTQTRVLGAGSRELKHPMRSCRPGREGTVLFRTLLSIS